MFSLLFNLFDMGQTTTTNKTREGDFTLRAVPTPTLTPLPLHCLSGIACGPVHYVGLFVLIFAASFGQECPLHIPLAYR